MVALAPRRVWELASFVGEELAGDVADGLAKAFRGPLERKWGCQFVSVPVGKKFGRYALLDAQNGVSVRENELVKQPSKEQINSSPPLDARGEVHNVRLAVIAQHHIAIGREVAVATPRVHIVDYAPEIHRTHCRYAPAHMLEARAMDMLDCEGVAVEFADQSGYPRPQVSERTELRRISIGPTITRKGSRRLKP